MPTKTKSENRSSIESGFDTRCRSYWRQMHANDQHSAVRYNNIESSFVEAVRRSGIGRFDFDNGEQLDAIAGNPGAFYDDCGPGIQRIAAAEAASARDHAFNLQIGHTAIVLSASPVTSGLHVEATADESHSIGRHRTDSIQVFSRRHDGVIHSESALVKRGEIGDLYKLRDHIFGPQGDDHNPRNSSHLIESGIGLQVNTADLAAGHDSAIHSVLTAYSALTGVADVQQNCNDLMQFDADQTTESKIKGRRVIAEFEDAVNALSDCYSLGYLNDEVDRMIQVLRLIHVVDFEYLMMSHNEGQTDLGEVLDFIEKRALKPMFERCYAVAIDAYEARDGLGRDLQTVHERVMYALGSGNVNIGQQAGIGFWSQSSDLAMQIMAMNQVETGGDGCTAANLRLEYERNSLNPQDQKSIEESEGWGYSSVGDCNWCEYENQWVGACNICQACVDPTSGGLRAERKGIGRSEATTDNTDPTLETSLWSQASVVRASESNVQSKPSDQV